MIGLGYFYRNREVIGGVVILSCLLGFQGCASVVVRLASEPEQSGRVANPSSQPNGIPKVQISTEKPTFALPEDEQSNPDDFSTVSRSISECDKQENILFSINTFKQETGEWCWAASAQTVMNYLGTHVEQCEIVDKVYSPDGVLTCCGEDKGGGACRKGGWPEYAFDAYGFKSDKIQVSTSMGWNIVEDEVCQKRPIIYAELFTQYTGHSSVISGFRKDANNENVVYIYDHDPDRIYEKEPTDFVEIPFEEISDLNGLHSLFYYINIHNSI